MRTDETWHRLLEWTQGQAYSERLAVQILYKERFNDVDPSHPLGGKDGGKDALAQKDGKNWLMAVYFPRGKKSYKDIQKKFLSDIKGVIKNKADAFVFVTNQEITVKKREALEKQAEPISVELYHFERIVGILDTPEMRGTRKQYLDIDYAQEGQQQSMVDLQKEFKRLEGLQTGGDSFCH